MSSIEDYSVEYLSKHVVRNGNDFALVYREGDAKVTLFAEAYRASATSTKYEIAVPACFLQVEDSGQLSEYGKKCLMRIRQFIDNGIWEFQNFGIPDIALNKDYGLPNWSLPDGRPYEKEMMVEKEKAKFVIKHGGLSDKACTHAGCNNRALRGGIMCVDHLMPPWNFR